MTIKREEAIKKAMQFSNFLQLHPEWNDDEEICLTNLSVFNYSYSLISERLKNNNTFHKKIIKEDPFHYKNLPIELKEDLGIAKEAVHQFGYILKHFSSNLQDNKEVVMNAVQQQGASIKYVSMRLRGGKGVAMAALNSKAPTYVYQFINDSLKDDKEIIKLAITVDYSAVKYLNKELQNDKHFIIKCILKQPKSFKNIPDILKEDYQLSSILINKNKDFIHILPQKLKNDKTFILKHFTDRKYFHCFGDQLKVDEDFLCNFFNYKTRKIYGTLIFLISIYNK